MRRRVIVLLAAVILAISLGFTGRATGIAAFDVIAGLAWLTVIVVAVSLLPFWRRVIPDVPAMSGLFTKPGADERWCAGCGSATARTQACHVCGATPRLKPAKAPKKAAKS